MSEKIRIWAEFSSGAAVLGAARSMRERGHTELDAYTPYPMPELEEVAALPRPRLLLSLILIGACTGGTLAFLIIWWTAAVSYPLNVGGRPLNSFITDIPILFESSVLGAAVTAFIGTLAFSGLPRLHEPLDELPGFERTTIDRFWLGLECEQSAREALASELKELGALAVRPTGARA
ncbi:MAG TPA: DUF3341 domain-containing protein [Polyangiaceae bacterium]|nr:DUF3341 domain-containing protein [Polyangiaceae bacterium]